MNRHRAPKGFTLLELVLVISLVGILSAVAAPSLQGVGKRSVLLAHAEELASRIAAARDHAIRHGRCVLLWVDTTTPQGKRTMEIAMRTDIECEGEAQDGSGSVGIRYDGSEVGLVEIPGLEMRLPPNSTVALGFPGANSDDVLVWRPTGWLRGDEYGNRTAAVKLSNDAWRIYVEDSARQAERIELVVRPAGLICVGREGGEPSCR